MQMKTSTFEGAFSKNTIYRFLNDVRINWQRFTLLLSAEIICRFMKPLTDKKRKDVFIVDDSLFDRSRSKKVALIHSAQHAGITAKFVLFDSWFSSPKTILELKKQEHLDTIAMMKKSRTKYRYQMKSLMSKSSTASTRSAGDVPAIFCPYL